jgi:tetratricopeptide (TPR) repeat protein
VLEKALIDEPDNSRYVFYLAQSYRDSKDPEMAIRYYRRRAEMGGWIDEVWYSLYQIPQLEAQLNRPWPEVMASYLAAYQIQPARAEPIFRIAMHYQSVKDFQTAKGFFEWALRIPRPGPTSLFVNRAMYDYLLELEYAVCCFYTGHHAEAIAVNDRLLARGTLPQNLVDRVIKNRQFSVNAIAGSVRTTTSDLSARTLTTAAPVPSPVT